MYIRSINKDCKESASAIDETLDCVVHPKQSASYHHCFLVNISTKVMSDSHSADSPDE